MLLYQLITDFKPIIEYDKILYHLILYLKKILDVSKWTLLDLLLESKMMIILQNKLIVNKKLMKYIIKIYKLKQHTIISYW